MFFRLFLLFTIVPVLELYLLIKIGALFGAAVTIGLVMLTGIAGAALARSQGISVLRAINEQASAGRLPAQELFEGLFILLGGITLLTPGFFTDVLGLACILPPSRRVFVKIVRAYVEKRIAKGNWQVHIGNWRIR